MEIQLLKWGDRNTRPSEGKITIGKAQGEMRRLTLSLVEL